MKQTLTLLLLAVLSFGAMADNVFSLPSLAEPQTSFQSKGFQAVSESNFIKRSAFEFRWAFNNWGSSNFNGLMGADLGGNSAKTSFSSYQLNYSYDLFHSDNGVNFGLGIGYESDVFKFTNAYVDFADGQFVVANPAEPGDWKSRFVTRYVQVPVHLGWSANRNVFSVRLSAVPAIGYSSKNTGLKRELKDSQNGSYDQRNLSDDLMPFKLDVRLDIKYHAVGLFFQIATIKQFKDGCADLYPIKFGIII